MPYSSLIFAGALAFTVSVIISFLIAKLIVSTTKFHHRFTMDNDAGIQKVHLTPTPRIGGLALLGGFALTTPFLHGETFRLAVMILSCGVFAYGAGFWEDITKTVSPRMRLSMALLSGIAFTAFSGTLLPLALPLAPDGSPEWVEWALIGMGIFGITVGLAGTTNAVNLIDGFHGLASGNIVIMSSTIGFLSYLEGDLSLAVVAFLFAFSVLGFMFVNFPAGRIFLGDGGAYLGGFVLGSMAVLLAARTDISAFVSILILAYPIYETLFSILRKSRRNGASPTEPDNLHLHHLVSRRYARFLAYGLGKPELKNSLTGLLMWPFSFLAGIMAIGAQGTHIGGIAGLLVFALFYGRIYRVVSLQKPSALQGVALRRGWNEADRYKIIPAQVSENT